MHLADAFIQRNLHHPHCYLLMYFLEIKWMPLGLLVPHSTVWAIEILQSFGGQHFRQWPHQITLQIYIKKKHYIKKLLRNRQTHSIRFRNTLMDRFLHETFVRTKHSSKLPAPQYVCNTHTGWHMALLTCLICCLPTQWCVCINNNSDSPGSACMGRKVRIASPRLISQLSHHWQFWSQSDDSLWLSKYVSLAGSPGFGMYWSSIYPFIFVFCHLPLCFLRHPWVWLTPAECGRRNIRRWELTQCVCGRSGTLCHVLVGVCICVWGDREHYGDVSAPE